MNMCKKITQMRIVGVETFPTSKYWASNYSNKKTLAFPSNPNRKRASQRTPGSNLRVEDESWVESWRDWVRRVYFVVGFGEFFWEWNGRGAAEPFREREVLLIFCKKNLLPHVYILPLSPLHPSCFICILNTSQCNTLTTHWPILIYFHFLTSTPHYSGK
jgi:hypothetical protein